MGHKHYQFRKCINCSQCLHININNKAPGMKQQEAATWAVELVIAAADEIKKICEGKCTLNNAQ